MKKRFFPEESLNGHHITYITLDISYCDYKKVRIRKIHKDYEPEELKKSKYIIDTQEMYIYNNQIDLDVFSDLTDFFNIFGKRYSNPDIKIFPIEKKDFSKYLGNVLEFEENMFKPREYFMPECGINVYVGMKNPDEDLNDNLCSVLHQICKKYLKPGVIFSSKEGLIYKIDNCSYSENIMKKFLKDFVITTEKTILKKIKTE